MQDAYVQAPFTDGEGTEEYSHIRIRRLCLIKGRRNDDDRWHSMEGRWVEAESKACTGSQFLVQAGGRGAFSPSLLPSPPRGERRVAEVSQSQAGSFMKAGALGSLSPCS